MIRWDPGDPYEIAFTTRVGGVSEGPFESLNLGLKTDDEPERAVENRRRACAAVGADAAALALNYQVHGTTVNRAAAGSRGVHGDALWTDEPGVPIVALDRRLPADRARERLGASRWSTPAGAACWTASSRTPVATLGGEVAAMIGPGIGPCCYEVGDEVREPYRARFGDEVVGRDACRPVARGGAGPHRLRCRAARPVHLVQPGAVFSHRRDGGRTGVRASSP